MLMRLEWLHTLGLSHSSSENEKKREKRVNRRPTSLSVITYHPPTKLNSIKRNKECTYAGKNSSTLANMPQSTDVPIFDFRIFLSGTDNA